MQTKQLNSDKATISGHKNNTSRKGFLRWAGLAAAGALVLALALACTTPTPEPSEKTAVAPTERAAELPAATATTAPAEATRESEAEKTPETETFEGTLQFIVVNGDDDSSARLAALNDQHHFESLFKARVGIESGVSAVAEIDMSDPAGRVMVRLKKEMLEGQNQPSEMTVKDLALSTETEAVIYQNEAEGLVFFWTESLGTAQFIPAQQDMVGEAVTAPMFDVRRDKTGDANWIKAVVGSDEQGASVYQLTYESDDKGNWVKLANPITVLESETIFAESEGVAEVEYANNTEAFKAMLNPEPLFENSETRLRISTTHAWSEVKDENGNRLSTNIQLAEDYLPENLEAVIDALIAARGDNIYKVIDLETGELVDHQLNSQDDIHVVVDVAKPADMHRYLELPNGEIRRGNFLLSGVRGGDEMLALYRSSGGEIYFYFKMPYEFIQLSTDPLRRKYVVELGQSPVFFALSLLSSNRLVE